MKCYFILLLIFGLNLSVNAEAVVLSNNSLILTHTSMYYHTGARAQALTHELLKENKGPVFALAQHPISLDKQWYGLPHSHINAGLYSKAGEHNFRFPRLMNESKFQLTVVGGYLSACLGRTLSMLIVNFVQDAPLNKTLLIHLPSEAIFTGFLSQNGELHPSTPYKESILDDSVDGLNLKQVLNHIKLNDEYPFFEETIKIALFQKREMNVISLSEYLLDIRLSGRRLMKIGSENSGKKIILDFI
jgi:hypothetical protein